MSLADAEKSFVFRETESFNGGIARWAAKHWIGRMMDVTRAAGVEWGHRQSASAAGAEALSALAQEMEVDVGELSKRAMPYVGDQLGSHGRRWFQGIQLPIALIESRVRRHAPAALALPGGDHHRILWDLRLLPVCVETGQQLLDRCTNPKCDGARVGWQHTLGIDRCEHCMADLSKSKADFIPSSVLKSLQEPVGLFVPSRRENALAMLPSHIATDGGQLAVDLLIRLLRVVDPSMGGDLTTLRSADPLRLCEALVQSWQLMTTWPQGFLDFARERVLNRKRSHDDGNAGETRRFLRMKPSYWISPELAALAVDLRRGVAVYEPGNSALTAATYSVKQVASILGLGTAQVADLRRRRVLRGVLVFDRDNLQPMFDRDEVDSIATGIADREGFDVIASRLGIPAYGIEQLAEMRLVDLQTHPFFAARYVYHQSTKRSLPDLERSIGRAERLTLSGPTVPLRRAMKAVGNRLKPWGPVISALISGELPYVVSSRVGPLFDRIDIGLADLPFIQALDFVAKVPPRLAHATKLSKNDAREILNSTPRQITRLFAHVPTEKGSHSRPIDLEDVLDLARKSMSVSELATRRNVKSQTAYREAVDTGVPRIFEARFCRLAAEAKYFPNSSTSSPTDAASTYLALFDDASRQTHPLGA